jgi:hypothetical protein
MTIDEIQLAHNSGVWIVLTLFVLAWLFGPRQW